MQLFGTHHFICWQLCSAQHSRMPIRTFGAFCARLEVMFFTHQLLCLISMDNIQDM